MTPERKKALELLKQVAETIVIFDMELSQQLVGFLALNEQDRNYFAVLAAQKRESV